MLSPTPSCCHQAHASANSNPKTHSSQLDVPSWDLDSTVDAANEEHIKSNSIELLTTQIEILHNESGLWPPESKSRNRNWGSGHPNQNPLELKLQPKNPATRHRDLPCCYPNQSYCCRVWSSAEVKLPTAKLSSLICGKSLYHLPMWGWTT